MGWEGEILVFEVIADDEKDLIWQLDEMEMLDFLEGVMDCTS